MITDNVCQVCNRPAMKKAGGFAVCVDCVEQVASRPRMRNLSPHDVVFVLGRERHVFPPEPKPARVSMDEEIIDTVLIDGLVPCDVVRLVPGPVEGLPDPEPGVLFIVSALVAAACPDRRDLVSPARLVRDEAGRVIGAGAFARGSM